MAIKLKTSFLFGVLLSVFCWPMVAQNTFTITGNNLKLTGSSSLVLNNTQFVNNGTFDAGTGTVVIAGNGTDAQSAISGTSATTFYNLEINKSSNGSQLQRAIQVDNELRMTLGNLDLNNNDLTLGTTNGIIIGESETSHITGASGGVVQKTVTLNAPTNINPGNMGMVCNSSVNIGVLTIKRGHIPQAIHGSQGIARFFEIDSPNDKDVGLNLQFNYLTAELNGNTEATLGLWRQDSSFWFNPPTASSDVSNNTVTVNNLNLLTKFTLASAAPKLALKVFLEGPYSITNSVMNDDLRTGSLLPTREPYTGLGYSHGSITATESINPFVFNATTNDALVDWVITELRDVNTNAIIAARSALLQKDGDIVDLDGRSPLSFPGIAIGGSYYIAVRHRNHIGIRSLNTSTMSATASTIDFTASSTGILGGSNALKRLSANTFALFSGDFDVNGQVQNTDATGLIQIIGTSGYRLGDLNMNGQVQNTDLQNSLRPNIGRGAQFNY